MLSTVPGYMLEGIKTCLTVETLAGWLRLARWVPRDWKLSEHLLASQVEHPTSHINVAQCHASEAKINSSITPLRAGTRPCTCCAWTTPTGSSGRSALHPNSYLFHIFKRFPTCFTLLNTVFSKVLFLCAFWSLQMTPCCMTTAYCCWKPLLLAMKFRLIRQDRINWSGQVNNMKKHCLACECCSHEGGTASTKDPVLTRQVL